MQAAEAKDASNADPSNAELQGPRRPAGGPGEAVRLQRRLGRRRPGRAGLRRPRLVHAVPPGPASAGRARLPHLRGDRRDPEAEDRRGGAGRQGVRGVQVSKEKVKSKKIESGRQGVGHFLFFYFLLFPLDVKVFRMLPRPSGSSPRFRPACGFCRRPAFAAGETRAASSRLTFFIRMPLARSIVLRSATLAADRLLPCADA